MGLKSLVLIFLLDLPTDPLFFGLRPHHLLYLLLTHEYSFASLGASDELFRMLGKLLFAGEGALTHGIIENIGKIIV